MGSGKKEATRREKQGKSGNGLNNVKEKGENFYRTGRQAKALNILNEGKAQRNSSGKIVKAASYQSRDKPNARIEPNRRWFGNTRVISQNALDSFREAIEQRASDPYSVLLKSNKLPMSLVRDGNSKNGMKQHQAKMQVESQPYNETFGPKSQRKRVKLSVGSLGDLAHESAKMQEDYLEKLEQTAHLNGTPEDPDTEAEVSGTKSTSLEPVFLKGQSRRIYSELYKVIDSSDVVIHVLDARDPLGTRCRMAEKHIKEEARHKHLVFLLNKCDLVPSSVAASWVRHLSKEYPTLAFHASITNSFGKGSLIALLRQFSSLHSNRKQISVGMIGYPNTGKSSVINTLRKKKVCNVAPIPGETKVWQYITLMKRIYLIDCPGVVPPNQNASPEDTLLRGVVRVENVRNPEQYIAAVLKKTKPHHIERTYNIRGFESPTEFLELMARKSGRLLKGGEADVDGVAKMVLNDFLRGKIPWFTPPPELEPQEERGLVGRRGALGEMGKVETATTVGDNSLESESRSDSDDDNAFEGFDDNEDMLEDSFSSQEDEGGGIDIRPTDHFLAS